MSGPKILNIHLFDCFIKEVWRKMFKEQVRHFSFRAIFGTRTFSRCLYKLNLSTLVVPLHLIISRFPSRIYLEKVFPFTFTDETKGSKKS